MKMRVRLLKEHASHPIGAVLVLPRDEAARLHRLEVAICLAEVPEDGEVVLPVVESAKTEVAPPVSAGRGRGRKAKR